MSGGLMQLVAYGAQDVYLTGSPQISFFKSAYRRHTNFAMQMCKVTAQGAVGFDKNIFFEFPRIGDLVTNTYLMVTLRAVKDNHFTGKFAWVKRLGHALIDYAQLNVGGSQIDKHYGMWLDLWYELTHTKSQEKGYRQMIGDVPELTSFSTAQPVTGLIKKAFDMYIPLQFWFCRNPGLALPLIALQYHQIHLEIKTVPKDRLIVFNGDFMNSKAFAELDADMKLLVNYVFLDTEERRKFAQVGHEYLIEQLQFTSATPLQNAPTATADTEIQQAVQLNFNHPTKELVWAVRNGNTINKPFLAYTDKEDWTDALDDAANSIAYGMFFISTSDETDPDVEKIESVNGEIETSPVHKVEYTIEVITSNSDSVTETQINNLYVQKKPLSILHYNLADKIDSVALTLTAGEDNTLTITKVIVLAHRLTVRDISIPLTKMMDKRRAKFDDIWVNIPFNYGLLIDGTGNPVHKAIIQLNGQDRFEEREGKFFNCLEPYQHHTNTPSDGVCVYSFAIKPEEHQPSGTANLSRIDTTFLNLKFKDCTQSIVEPSLGYFSAESQLYVYAKNYNVFRVMSGMGGIAYSN